MDISILNDKKRMFKAILTAEVKDSDGQVVPVDEVLKVLPDYISEGGAILYRHMGRPVGKVINFMPTKLNDVPAIEIIGLIGNSFDYHNEVWDAIKSGELKGVSFHGDAILDPNGKIQVISGVEISITPKPANPMAMVQEVSVLAKESGNMEIQKKDECKAKYTNPDNSFKGGFDGCVAYMKDCRGLAEENAQKLCAYIGRKTGHMKEAVKEQDYNPIIDFLKEVDSMKKEIKKQDEQTPEETKPNVEEQIKTLSEAVAELKQQVSELASKIEAKPEEEVQEEDNTQKPEEPKPEEQKPEVVKEMVKEAVDMAIKQRLERIEVNKEKPAEKTTLKKEKVLKVGKKTYTEEDINKLYA